MNKLFDHYPTFYSGEILTPQKLNDIAAYSDNQMQITRAELLGYGIVSGLTYNYSSTTHELTIEPGVAITPDGKAIVFEKSVSYKYMEKLRDGNFQLVEKETGISSLLQKSSAQVLVIKYVLENERMFQCLQESCDIVNERTRVKFLPMLVPVNKLEKACVKDFSPMDSMRLYRFNEIADSLVTNFLHDTVRSYFNKNVDIVISCYKDIAKRFNRNEGPLHFLFQSRKPYILKTEFHNALQILEKLKKQSRDSASMSDKKSKSDAASPEIPVYYLHFLEDIEDAYNEWRDYYTFFLDKYHNRLFRPEVKIDDDTVMVGIKDGADDDSYRNHFMSTIMNESVEADIRMLQMLLYRMCAMVNNFYRTSCQWRSQSVKINSVCANKPLKCRPIPFYYRSGESFVRAWTLETNLVNGMGTTRQIQYDSSIMVSAFNNPYDCYQIGGYYNRSVESVVSELNDIISANNLHLTVETVELKEIGRLWYNKMKKSLTTTTNGQKPSVNGVATKKIYANKDKILNLLKRSHMSERMGLKDRHALMESIKAFDLEQAKKELVQKRMGNNIVCIAASDYPSLVNYLGKKESIDNLELELPRKEWSVIKKEGKISYIQSVKRQKLADSQMLNRLTKSVGLELQNKKEIIKGGIDTSRLQSVIDSYYEEFLKEDNLRLQETSNIQLDFTILTHLQAMAEQCLSEKYRFADHRFVPRKSTLYVATFRGKVIFCFGA